MSDVENYIEGEQIWSGGNDGSAFVLNVKKGKDFNGAMNKMVKFLSIESQKVYLISKPHFLGRFPDKVK